MALNFPDSPGIGSVFADTTSGFSYEWDGTVWKSYSPAAAQNIKNLDDISGSFNGSTQTFDLKINNVIYYPRAANLLQISLGGIIQEPDTDYTVNYNEATITFTTAPDAGLDFFGVVRGTAVAIDYANDGNVQNKQNYTATAGQTAFTFSAGYTSGYLNVYRNGIKLRSTDFTETSSTVFTLNTPAQENDEIEAIGYVVASIVTTQGNLQNLNVVGVATISSNTFINSTGIDVTGIVTATSFSGDGSGLTGVASTDNIITSTPAQFLDNVSVSGILTATTGSFGGNVSIAGTLTYEDVTNVDSIGLITARSGIEVSGIITARAGYALTYYGDGSQLQGVVSGVEVFQAGSSVGTSITAINFASGATLTGGSGFSTVTVVAPSISTTSSSPSANTVVTLDLDSAQHHELTLSAGITTITCSGGSFGDSHSVVLIQPSSGITTVGLSTYFLFPSGSSPSFSEGSSQIDLLSFVVKRVGAAGTQLLTSAGLNYL